jgi:hypothetical protein
MNDLEQFERIDNVLRAWARWRWEAHGANVGYPSQCPFRRLMLVEGESNLPAAMMSDDLALNVDLAVSSLKLRSHPVKDDHRWIVIMDSYLGGYLDRQIAYHRKLSRSSVRNARIAGENWIEGFLLTRAELTQESSGIQSGSSRPKENGRGGDHG